ncbi:MAG: alpha/beta hydrolase [Jatrophihabitantaceae bacterium]
MADRPDSPHCHRRGSGPPVLLIQGAAAGRLHWGERFLAELSGRCDVIAYDPAGIGGSAGCQPRITMAELAEDAVRLLDEVGWPSCTVVGVSAGGVVAQELALNAPDRVARLVLGGSNAGGASASARTIAADARLAAAVVPGDRATTSSNLFRLAVKDPERASGQAWAEYLAAEQAVRTDPAMVLAQVEAHSRHSTLSRLPSLQVPTLVIHGDDDRVIDLEDAVILARTIPNAQLRVLSAGHFFWLELPQHTADLIADWCESPEAYLHSGGDGASQR